MADTMAQPKPHTGRADHLRPFMWNQDRAREAQRKAQAVIAERKANEARLAAGIIDSKAILADEIKDIRAKMRRARDPGAIKTLWSVLKDMLKASEPDQPKPEPSQTGPIKPLV